MRQKFNADREVMSRYFPHVLVLGLLLFIPLFVYRQIAFLDFWWWMSLNLVFLVGLTTLSDSGFRRTLSEDLQFDIGKKVVVGIASAAILYLVFYVGNEMVRYVLDFAGRDISHVYGFKGNAALWRIGVLMLLIIGPGEELLWRGYVQGNLARKYGKVEGYILATLIYTAIHVATGNLVLILAALAGGVFWGWMYMRYQSLLMNSVSHIVWDIAVFLLLPFNG